MTLAELLAGIQASQSAGFGATGADLSVTAESERRALQDAQRQLQEQEKAREAAFEPFTRLGLIGPQLASVIGGFPAATQLQTTPPPSTTQQLLGLGIGAAGLGGAVKSIFS